MKNICLILAAALLIAQGTAFGEAETPRVVAHRGQYQYDDNALGGFLQSLAAGVTGFETDVQMTSDGGFVLMHNSTVDATTTGSGDVKNLTFDAVTNLTLKTSGEHVPALQQLADAFAGRADLFVEFEMKNQGFTGDTLNQYVDGVHSIVAGTMVSGTYVFTSFSTSYLQAMKTRHPDARIGLIVDTALTQAQIDSALSLGCCQVAPLTASTAEMVAAARAAGLGVTLWMVEDLATWQACREKGATATTSNHPLTLYAAATNALAAAATAITSWNGERYFTNDVPVTISTKLSGSEGLGKWGAGDLTITGVDHDYTGDVILAGGHTYLTGANDVKDVQRGALGHPRVQRTLMVTNGAWLCIRGMNAIAGGGTSSTPVLSELHVADAAICFQTNFSCNLGDVYFHNATIEYFDGYPMGWRIWGTLLCRNLFFSGTRTYTFPMRGGSKVNDDCGLLIGKWAPDRMGEIRVPDLSGNADTDVNFGWNIFCSEDSQNTTDGCIGSFRKTGAGTLELSSGQNNFRGNIRVEEGTLKLSGNNASLAAQRSCLGNTQVVHTNYVGAGATLWLAGSDMQGQYYNDSKIVTHVHGGTLKANGWTSNQMGPVILEDATLDYKGRAGSSYYWATKNGDGSWTTNGPAFTSPWPTFGFHGGLTVKGTTPLTLPKSDTSALGFGANYMSDIYVADITGNSQPDLTIGMPIINAGSWYRHDAQRITGTNKLGVATSFRKTGPGTLLFNDGTRNSDFTGAVEVVEGVLSINRADSGWGRFYTYDSPLGHTAFPHPITVHSGGVLEFASADILGQLSKYCPGPQLVVSNGTLRLNAGCCNGLPNLKFFNGTFTYVSGSLGGRQWGIFGFGGKAEFDGDNGEAYVLPNASANNWVSLGYGTDFTAETNAAGTAVLYKGFTELCVRDVTRDAAVDVTINPIIQDLPDWPTRTDNDTVVGKGRPVYFSCGLRKTGAGTLRVTNNNTYTGATEVVAGSLLVDSSNSRSPVTVKAGGRLGGVGKVPSLVIEAGGGFTAAPGQTGSLTVTGTLTLPANNEVGIDVAYAGDLEGVESIRVPVVAATGLAGVKWRGTINGAEPPRGYRVSGVVSGGVVYGVYARSGCAIVIR